MFGAEPSGAEQEGLSLASDLRNLQLDQTFQASFKIRRGKVRTEIPVTCLTVTDSNHWDNIFEVKGEGAAPAEKLVIRHFLQGTNQYFHARAASPGKPLPELQEIPGTGLGASFAGSDFSFADLGLEFLHWPNQRQLKGEMRLGRPCYVLESTSGSPGNRRVKSWIDKETAALLIVESYDSQNKIEKEFSLSGTSVKKVNGKWRVEEMKIQSPQTDSQTILKFIFPEEPAK